MDKKTLPPISNKCKYVSDSINIILNDNTVIEKGFYDHCHNRWFTERGALIDEKNIKGWIKL